MKAILLSWNPVFPNISHLADYWQWKLECKDFSVIGDSYKNHPTYSSATNEAREVAKLLMLDIVKEVKPIICREVYSDRILDKQHAEEIKEARKLL